MCTCMCDIDRELQGVIVWLDELGHLTCSYLGTDPTLFTASTRGKRDLNYQVGEVNDSYMIGILFSLVF